jgi:hypothetical protein
VKPIGKTLAELSLIDLSARILTGISFLTLRSTGTCGKLTGAPPENPLIQNRLKLIPHVIPDFLNSPFCLCI